MPALNRRWSLLYISWIALCAILFIALRNQDDPSRRHGRILSNDAGRLAVRYLDARGERGYEAVHAAWAGKGEGVDSPRWVVLCDREPRTGLRDALVVEIDGANGALLRVRKPE